MTSSPPYSTRIGPIGKTGHSLSSCVLRTIASLLEEPHQVLEPEHSYPLGYGLLALTVHPEDPDRKVRSSIGLGLLEGRERGESPPRLALEPDTRRTEKVTTLTACPRRFHVREYLPNVVSGDALCCVPTVLTTLTRQRDPPSRRRTPRRHHGTASLRPHPPRCGTVRAVPSS